MDATFQALKTHFFATSAYYIYACKVPYHNSRKSYVQDLDTRLLTGAVDNGALITLRTSSSSEAMWCKRPGPLIGGGSDRNMVISLSLTPQT